MLSNNYGGSGLDRLVEGAMHCRSFWAAGFLLMCWAIPSSFAAETSPIFVDQGAEPKRQVNTLKELFRSYREACRQPLERYQDTLPFRSLFGLEFYDQLRENIGTLVGRNGSSGLQCTASVVSLSKEPKRIGLLTAAHCLGATRSMGTESSQIESVFKSLVFTSLFGRKMPVHVKADVREWIYPQRNDLVLVPASDNTRTQIEGLSLTDPRDLKGWDPLYLVGVNPIMMALANAERTGTDEIRPAQATTITLAAPCRVVGLDRGRLVHNCETGKHVGKFHLHNQ
ncbi:hypothetical protein MXD81_31340 [Microbacteriaceae bacterium K1510]|nr:hypothetical protein [Microbacteriaceae bacterium K1510]